MVEREIPTIAELVPPFDFDWIVGNHLSIDIFKR